MTTTILRAPAVMKRTTLAVLAGCGCAAAPTATRAYYETPPQAALEEGEEQRVAQAIRAESARRGKPEPQLDTRLVLACREVIEQEAHDLETEQRWPGNGVEWYGASWDGRRELHAKGIDLDVEAGKAAAEMAKLHGPVFYGVAYDWSTLRQAHDLVIIWDERPVALENVPKAPAAGSTLEIAGRVLGKSRYVVEIGLGREAIAPGGDGRFSAKLPVPASPGHHLLVVRDAGSGRLVEKLLLYVGVPAPDAPTMSRLECSGAEPEPGCSS